MHCEAVDYDTPVLPVNYQAYLVDDPVDDSSALAGSLSPEYTGLSVPLHVYYILGSSSRIATEGSHSLY
jgi:hypothetical protein